MKRSIPLLILLLCGLSMNPVVYAQKLFKSAGPDGKITYSTRPPAENQVLKKLEFEDLPSSAVPDLGPAPAGQESASVPVSGTVLYAAEWCGYCKKAKAYLADKNIPYQEIDVDSEDGKLSYAQAAAGKTGIPLLLTGEQRVQGFSTGAYDELFANR